MKHFKHIAYSIAALALLCGCSEEFNTGHEGDATLYLSASMTGDVTVQARGADGTPDSCSIVISNSKGPVREYETIGDIPAGGIKLVADTYTVTAVAGDSVPASWTQRFFKGNETFTLSGGDSKKVELECRIVNSVVAVKTAPAVSDIIADYSFTIGHSGGSLTFDAATDSTAHAYFITTANDPDLRWTLECTTAGGEHFTKTGTVAACKPATLYTFTITVPTSDQEIGGMLFDIELQEIPITKTYTVTVKGAPTIRSLSDNYTMGDYLIPAKETDYPFGIYALSAIGEFTVTCPAFDPIFGYGSDVIDFNYVKDATLNDIAEAGIVYKKTTPENGMEYINLDFKREFFSRLSELGINNTEIIIRAVDATGRVGTASITVTNAPVAVGHVEDYNVWATHALLSGQIISEDATGVTLQYRVKNAPAWTSAETKVEGTTVTANVTGLSPETTYQYRIVDDSGYESDAREFTTDSSPQLPNSSFENYQGSSPIYFYANGESMWWDSGNKGSSTIGKNVTVPATDMVHSGKNSVALESQKVVIQFAAGNIFIGEFLATENTTNGVLGWGREFTGRPSAMRVYAHYTPKNIDNIKNNAPDEYKTGDPDRGIIYIALLDDFKESYTLNGKTYIYPVIVRTTVPQLYEPFGRNNAHTIAYGEHVFNGPTPGNQLVEVTVPLDYDSFAHNKNKRPSHILLTASASKGGDYFTGGDGSRLVLDDIELIY